METVVSCFVLCLVMVALFNLFPSSMYALKRGECQLLAEQEAQSWLEIYRAQPFDSLPNSAGPLALPARPPVNGVTYSPEVTIIDGASAGYRTDLIKGIDIKVSWTFQSNTRSIQRREWVSKLKP